MTTGTIKKLISDRGFGFITAEDGQDHFFHLSTLDVPFEAVHGLRQGIGRGTAVAHFRVRRVVVPEALRENQKLDIRGELLGTQAALDVPDR